MKSGNNLTVAQLDKDTLELLLTLFKLYSIAKSKTIGYKKSEYTMIPRYLIQQYYKYVKPEYNNMLDSFKKKYINNETLIENNNSPEEKKGMRLVYDYIQNFDIENDDFNIFLNAMQINLLLYKPLDAKHKENYDKQIKLAFKLQDEAKKEKNIEKYKQAREILNSEQYTTFGGKLRNSSVVMQNYDVEVPDAKEASKLFNEYLNPSKIEEYNYVLENANLIEYIKYAVNTTADLIGIQPFEDGNKRTFRSLLNLMFKKRNLPPVYILKKENKEYHDALEKALKDKDYNDLDTFYYKKICDSIYELDFVPYFNTIKENYSVLYSNIENYNSILFKNL